MGYKLNLKEVNELFNELKKEYIIYAPKDLRSKEDTQTQTL